MIPRAAVLCGICDRFVRLAFAVTLGTTVAFLFMPWASILFAAATVALALVLLQTAPPVPAAATPRRLNACVAKYLPSPYKQYAMLTIQLDSIFSPLRTTRNPRFEIDDVGIPSPVIEPSRTVLSAIQRLTMATRPLPEAVESRYAPYIQELHEFFATSGVPFGSPDDAVLVADRLQEKGSFSEDLGSLIRSMVLREGGAMPHAQLLEILSLAIAGPELALAPQQYRDPLRQLLAFISGVMRRPWNVPSTENAEVVPFPTADTPTANTPTRTSEPETFAPRVAIFEKMRDEQMRNQHAEPLSRTVEMPIHERSDTVARASTHPVTSTTRASQRRLTPLQRNFLLGAGGIMALAAILMFLMRPTTPAEVFQVGPAPTQVAAPAHIAVNGRMSPRLAQPEQPVASSANPSPASSPVVSGQIQDTAPAKPSANGQSDYPQLNRHPKTAVSAPSNSSSAQPASQAPPQSATGAIPSPSSPTTEYPSSVEPNVSEASAAPVVRHPLYRDPDSSIAGDLPTGQSSGPSSPSRSFTVSSGVMASYLISHPDPEYPTLARLAHIQGQVIMQAVVAKDGSVSTVRVLRGNRLLRRAAEEAVRTWRYRPYRFGGRAIDVATIVTVDFHNHN